MGTAPIILNQENILRLRRAKRRVDIKELARNAVSELQSAGNELEDLVEELDGIGSDRDMVLSDIDKFLERIKFSLAPVTKEECIDFIKQLRNDIAI